MSIHKKKGIFEEAGDFKRVWKVTGEAGDNWRIMCKHLYNLKKQEKVDLDKYPKVKQMVADIVLPEHVEPRTQPEHVEPPSAPTTQPEHVEPPSAPSIKLDEVKSMFSCLESDSQDVDSCIMMDPSSSQETLQLGPPLSMEDAGEQECMIVNVSCQCPFCKVAIPSAARGGQKTETLSGEKLKL